MLNFPNIASDPTRAGHKQFRLLPLEQYLQTQSPQRVSSLSGSLSDEHHEHNAATAVGYATVT